MHFSRPPPHLGPGRRDPGTSGRHAATSKSSIAWTNAARSMGARAVTILPSVTAGSSIKVAPAFSRSGLILHQPVARLPRVSPASERTQKRTLSKPLKLCGLAALAFRDRGGLSIAGRATPFRLAVLLSSTGQPIEPL